MFHLTRGNGTGFSVHGFVLHMYIYIDITTGAPRNRRGGGSLGAADDGENVYFLCLCPYLFSANLVP